MKVLVTGATGYIGSHVCKILNERGHKVWGVDINPNQNDVSKYCTKFIEGDIIDLKRLGKFDAVVHLAGLISVEESTKKPSIYYYNNFCGTGQIIEQYPDAHLIFASTAGAFNPQSPYATSKIACEDIIKEYCKKYTIFRFFNVAGSDGVNMQQGTSTHLIRIAAEAAVGKREKVYIYGNDYPTRDGTCVRDYIHVVDLAGAIANTVEHGPHNTPYECLGSGKGYTVLEVLEAMKTLYDIKWEYAGRREGDPPELAINNEFKLLNIKHSLLDMCASAVEAEKLRNNK